MGDDKSNVVKLHVKKVPVQPVAAQASITSGADPIVPKSILNMTEVEQEMFLRSLRDRRLRAADVLAQAREAKKRVVNTSNNIKLGAKIAAVQKQHDKVEAALKKLEDMLLSLRALQVHVTPTTKD